MRRNKAIRQAAQGIGQIGVGGFGVCPQGVAADFRNCDGPQNRDQRRHRFKRRIGVPDIGLAAVRRVEFKQGAAPAMKRIGRYLAQGTGKGCVGLVIERLAAQEQHLVAP